MKYLTEYFNNTVTILLKQTITYPRLENAKLHFHRLRLHVYYHSTRAAHLPLHECPIAANKTENSTRRVQQPVQFRRRDSLQQILQAISRRANVLVITIFEPAWHNETAIMRRKRKHGNT